MADLRAAVNGIRCPDHGYAPALTLDLGGEENPSVVVIPQGCCSKLDRLVACSVASSPVFRVFVPDDSSISLIATGDEQEDGR